MFFDRNLILIIACSIEQNTPSRSNSVKG